MRRGRGGASGGRKEGGEMGREENARGDREQEMVHRQEGQWRLWL